MEKLSDIVSYLDRELAIHEFEDKSNNGLQVANRGKVRRICCGVDATLPFFDEAARRKADMVICHHGLSWGDSLKYVTGLNYALVSHLVERDMALYGCHLPLDAHPRYGNNAQIFKALGLVKRQRFGLYNGRAIGYAGRLPRPMTYTGFKKRVAAVMGRDVQSMDFGKRTVHSVAIISGGAAAEIEQAGQQQIDVYVSGEPALLAYHLAEAYHLNAIFAGHYATEVFGVRALAGLLEKRFDVSAEFIDFKIPF